MVLFVFPIYQNCFGFLLLRINMIQCDSCAYVSAQPSDLAGSVDAHPALSADTHINII